MERHRAALRDDAVSQLVAEVRPQADGGQDGAAGARRDARGLEHVRPLLTLPFAIGANAQPPADGGNPIGWLLVVLAKSIGLPFFALAATAPILQRWFVG